MDVAANVLKNLTPGDFQKRLRQTMQTNIFEIKYLKPTFYLENRKEKEKSVKKIRTFIACQSLQRHFIATGSY